MTTLLRVVAQPQEADSRLAELGISSNDLIGSIQQGLASAASCTSHDPLNLPGLIQWGRSIRALRDALVPRGWRSENSRNYPTVVSPDSAVALSVAGGDHNTGLAYGTPATRSAKGPATKDAIALNQLSFAELDASFAEPETVPKVTWLLLHYHDRDTKEVRLELSLPAGLDSDGVVTSWHERILLPPFSTTYEPPPDSDAQPIDVQITRR